MVLQLSGICDCNCSTAVLHGGNGAAHNSKDLRVASPKVYHLCKGKQKSLNEGLIKQNVNLTDLFDILEFKMSEGLTTIDYRHLDTNVSEIHHPWTWRQCFPLVLRLNSQSFLPSTVQTGCSD